MSTALPRRGNGNHLRKEKKQAVKVNLGLTKFRSSNQTLGCLKNLKICLLAPKSVCGSLGTSLSFEIPYFSSEQVTLRSPQERLSQYPENHSQVLLEDKG